MTGVITELQHTEDSNTAVLLEKSSNWGEVRILHKYLKFCHVKGGLGL